MHSATYILRKIGTCANARLYSLSNTELKKLFPDKNYGTKILKVAVIGMPNAGKSTFINNIMDRKVCPASSKVHTTKKRSMAIFTQGNSQIIFLDTPGIVSMGEQKKFNLNKTFTKDGKSSLQEADIIGVVHDVSNQYTQDRLDMKILKMLEIHKKRPSFLVLNKVDLLKSKRKLLDLTKTLTGNRLANMPNDRFSMAKMTDEEVDIKKWPYFQEIFMISALTGSGTKEIKNFLIKLSKPGKWMFPDNVWSDQSAEDIIVSSVRATLLDFYQQEIPYRMEPHMEYFDIAANGKITTVVIVKCPSERITKLAAGSADRRLHDVTAKVQKDLQDTFQNFVRIKIVLQAPVTK